MLYRINSRSEEFEEALAEAGIPYQVRGGAFLARPGARGMIRALRGSTGRTDVAEIVRGTAEAQGLTPTLPAGIGEEELTRQGDLARFVRLAEEFGDGTVGDFLADLESRFGEESAGRGVNLLTYHRAKGLEFEVVFLPRLEEGELPFKRSRSPEALAEERRLLYVGMTRAKRHLELTWSGAPSRFIAELGVEAPSADPTVAHRAESLAAGASQKGRGARVRRLPRHDARGDRPPPPARAVGAREGLRRRPDEARALRRRATPSAGCRANHRVVPPRSSSRSAGQADGEGRGLAPPGGRHRRAILPLGTGRGPDRAAGLHSG